MEKARNNLPHFFYNIEAQGKWNWIICNLPLKQIINGENTQWTLQPSIALSHPSGQVRLFFFLFFNKLGP